MPRWHKPGQKHTAFSFAGADLETAGTMQQTRPKTIQEAQSEGWSRSSEVLHDVETGTVEQAKDLHKQKGFELVDIVTQESQNTGQYNETAHHYSGNITAYREVGQRLSIHLSWVFLTL